MPGLPELQARFVAAVLRQDEAGAAAWLCPEPLTSGERLNIYRITARENFALALEAAYPLLRRFCGDREFRQMAWSYQRAQPSRSGNLYFAGEGLPAFLEQRLDGTPDHHLIGVARLEWACQECLVAPEPEQGLDLGALAAVPAGRLAGLRFQLHPAVRLVVTACPVFAAWQALQAGQTGALPSPPGFGTEHLLVHRRDAGLELHRLMPGEFAWLAALGDGTPLGELVEIANDSGASDAGGWLARWGARGVLAAFVTDS